MLTNNFVNSTHYGELIDAVEYVSDTSVNSIRSVESYKRRGKAKVYLVKSFDSKKDALNFLVDEVLRMVDLFGEIKLVSFTELH